MSAFNTLCAISFLQVTLPLVRALSVQIPFLVLIVLGACWFCGQVDRSHAITLRLSIDDQPDQDKVPVYSAAWAGGRRALA